MAGWQTGNNAVDLMIRKAGDLDHQEGTESAILRVLEDVVARRGNGDLLSDDAVIEKHPHLMPSLGEQLAALRFTEAAREIAAHSSTSAHLAGSLSGREFPDRRPMHPGQIERDMFRGYELGEIVGQGATGLVYRALQKGTGREVAIKVMIQGPFEEEADQARFEREARVLAQLRHPNIVTVYDTGWSNGRFFLVMDLVRGLPLDQWIRSHNLSVDEKLTLIAAIAETVHAAHLRGVIHRDLKPGNIRVDELGCPHLLDFGLAKVISTGEPGGAQPPPAYAHSMTMTGQFVGSLPWASPEQAEGAPDKIDIRSDIYSLGVIAYHAFAGRFPYSVIGNLRDVIDRILSADPPRLRTLDYGIDDDVDTIIATCLQKERERRYQSAGDLAQDLRRRLAGEPISAKRDSSWYVLRKAIRRHRVGAGVVLGIAVLTMVYAATMSVLYSQAQSDAHRARRTLSFLQDTLFQASSHRMGSSATLSQVLDDASRRVPQEFAAQPEIEAALHYTLGAAYESIWQKNKGIEHLRRGLELNRKVYGDEHEETFRNMVLLGAVLAETGDPAGVAILRDSLALGIGLYGKDSVQVANALGELAFALWAASQPPHWEEAKKLYEQSISLFNKTAGTEHPDLARTLAGSASMNRARGEVALAETQFIQSCEMSASNLGEAHQFTLECKIGLSDLFVDLGRHDEAQAILDQLAPLAERQFGARMMPSILRRTAYVQMARQDLESAERTLFDVQAIVCERMSLEVAEHAEQFREFAAKLRDRVGKKGADAVYLDSLMATQKESPDALEAARSLVALGQIRVRQQRFNHAEQHLRRCLEYLSLVPSPQYSIRTRAVRMLATCLQFLGQLEEAESLLRETLVLLQNSLGPNDPSTLNVASDLVLIYHRSGRMEEAAALQSVTP